MLELGILFIVLLVIRRLETLVRILFVVLELLFFTLGNLLGSFFLFSLLSRKLGLLKRESRDSGALVRATPSKFLILPSLFPFQASLSSLGLPLFVVEVSLKVGLFLRLLLLLRVQRLLVAFALLLLGTLLLMFPKTVFVVRHLGRRLTFRLRLLGFLRLAWS